MGKPSGGKTEMLAEVNRSILEAATRSPSGETVWEFFCECGADGCSEHVLLSLEAYVALRDGGGHVLADGHRLSQIERARRLGGDAEALRRQAEH